MKLKTTTIILIIAFIIGVSLLLYPSFSNYWNMKHATRVVNEYTSLLQKIDTEKYLDMWTSAVEYNEALLTSESNFALPPELQARYNHELILSANGLMGYVEIPSIGVSLPIYHGTSEGVLQIGVGHIEWSSLPTGGANTHCVLSGHRGLPSAKLFTDLNKLREGDTFTLNILNEVMTYEVDQILIVVPNDLKELVISEGNDFCTLVTCTPYGVNTHRMLVRGHRIETDQTDMIRVISEGVVIDPLLVAPVVGFPFVITLFLMVMLKKPKKKKKVSLLSGKESGQ